MTITTESGPLQVNKRSHFGKWMMGWKDGGGWTGYHTICKAYDRARSIKPDGCSWYALGYVQAKSQYGME